MHPAVAAIVEEQRRSLEAAAAESSVAMARSGWYELLAAIVLLLLGEVVLYIVQQVNRELRHAATCLNEGAEEIASFWSGFYRQGGRLGLPRSQTS